MQPRAPGFTSREKIRSEIGRDASEIGRDASEIGRDASEIGRDFSPGITDPESTRALAPGSADAALTVVPMQNWHRDEFYDQTGVPWINPSPNLRSVAEATLYPGLGMLDATNVSVGRGTATPFEVFGAGATPAIKDSPAQPAWFEGKAVAGYLTARNIPGVSFADNEVHRRRRREPLSLPRADHRRRAPHRHRPRRSRLPRTWHRDPLRAASSLSHPVQTGKSALDSLRTPRRWPRWHMATIHAPSPPPGPPPSQNSRRAAPNISFTHNPSNRPTSKNSFPCPISLF